MRTESMVVFHNITFREYDAHDWVAQLPGVSLNFGPIHPRAYAEYERNILELLQTPKGTELIKQALATDGKIVLTIAKDDGESPWLVEGNVYKQGESIYFILNRPEEKSA